MGSMIEAHFCGIASQSSIYGLTSLFTGESSHKVLVASSRRKVYCIEYSKNPYSVIFSTRVVQFTYIPGLFIHIHFHSILDAVYRLYFNIHFINLFNTTKHFIYKN